MTKASPARAKTRPRIIATNLSGRIRLSLHEQGRFYPDRRDLKAEGPWQDADDKRGPLRLGQEGLLEDPTTGRLDGLLTITRWRFFR